MTDLCEMKTAHLTKMINNVYFLINVRICLHFGSQMSRGKMASTIFHYIVNRTTIFFQNI